MPIDDQTIADKRNTYAIVYLGAPYGDNEGGHIVSLHRSKGSAEYAWRRMGELLSREHAIVALDDPTPNRRWVGGTIKTPRDYFLLS